MSRIAESMVSLRVAGDNLVPAEVTALLGVEPSLSYRKGEVLSSRSGKEILRKTGMWSLRAEVCKPEEVDAQVAELLSKLPGEPAVWSNLSARFDIDLFCGLFMNESNEGLSLSADTLRALSERGIEISLDIYGPTEEGAHGAKA